VRGAIPGWILISFKSLILVLVIVLSLLLCRLAIVLLMRGIKCRRLHIRLRAWSKCRRRRKLGLHRGNERARIGSERDVIRLHLLVRCELRGVHLFVSLLWMRRLLVINKTALRLLAVYHRHWGLRGGGSHSVAIHGIDRHLLAHVKLLLLATVWLLVTHLLLWHVLCLVLTKRRCRGHRHAHMFLLRSYRNLLCRLEGCNLVSFDLTEGCTKATHCC